MIMISVLSASSEWGELELRCGLNRAEWQASCVSESLRFCVTALACCSQKDRSLYTRRKSRHPASDVIKHAKLPHHRYNTSKPLNTIHYLSYRWNSFSDPYYTDVVFLMHVACTLCAGICSYALAKEKNVMYGILPNTIHDLRSSGSLQFCLTFCAFDWFILAHSGGFL